MRRSESASEIALSHYLLRFWVAVKMEIMFCAVECIIVACSVRSISKSDSAAPPKRRTTILFFSLCQLVHFDWSFGGGGMPQYHLTSCHSTTSANPDRAQRQPKHQISLRPLSINFIFFLFLTFRDGKKDPPTLFSPD